MKHKWQMTALGSMLITGICSSNWAEPIQQRMPLDDRLRVAVFGYQMRHLDAPMVSFLLGGTWASGHGQNVVMHHETLRNPNSTVVRLSLRQGPSAFHGVFLHLVRDGPDLGQHGSDTLSVSALRWVSPTHAMAYGSVRSYPPAGSNNEGSVTFYVYELHRGAFGWTVTSSKSITGYG